jgi:hypothetical protein
MIKKIKHISIGLENCDRITIKREDVYHYSVTGVTEFYSSCNSNQGLFGHSAKKVLIIFKEEVFDKLKYESNFIGKDKKESVKERLSHFDITSFGIEHANGCKIDFYTSWGSNERFFNANQTIKKSKGFYSIEISKGWTVRKVINLLAYKARKIQWKIKQKFTKF